jgi:hypothetical protein
MRLLRRNGNTGPETGVKRGTRASCCERWHTDTSKEADSRREPVGEVLSLVTAKNLEAVGGARRGRGGEGGDVGVVLEELGRGRRGRRVDTLDRMRRDMGGALVE